MPKIEFENLSITYLDRKRNEYPVLKNVSGCFESGSINVIAGASGTGKSTLLKAIAGQLDFDGVLRFDGNEIKNPSQVRKENIAYIDQEGFLYQNKIVYDILAFPLKQQHLKVGEIDEKVKNMADMLGISNLLTRKPRQLSLGQRQKVAFGKALIKNPKICLFDEPFSNLDEASRTFCLSLLHKMVVENNMTVLLISHETKEADLLGAAIYSLDENGLVKIKDFVEKSISNEMLPNKLSEEQVKLPVNRKQLFGDILRNRFYVLFLVGMMLLIFSVPLIVVSLLNDLTLVSFFADPNNYVNGAMTESGRSLYRSIALNFTLFYALSLLIFSIGIAGVSRVIRQLCWEEGLYFFNSFGKGIKQNVIRFLVMTLFIDMVFIAASLLFTNVDVLWPVIVVSAVGGFVLLPIVFFSLGYSVIYVNPFPKAIANSVILAIKHYPAALLFSIVYILPFFVGLIPSGLSIVKTVLLILFAFILWPLLLLIGGLVLNSVFDKEINIENHKDIYRKGLY